MPMIAFSGLVVIAQNAFAIHDEREPAFQPVTAAVHRYGNFPNDDLGEFPPG